MTEREPDATETTETIEMTTTEETLPSTRPAVTAPSRGVRVGALVWGLLVAAIAAGMLAIANGAVFDIELSIILLLAAAGLVLLVGSVVRARRRV